MVGENVSELRRKSAWAAHNELVAAVIGCPLNLVGCVWVLIRDCRREPELHFRCDDGHVGSLYDSLAPVLVLLRNVRYPL